MNERAGQRWQHQWGGYDHNAIPYWVVRDTHSNGLVLADDRTARRFYSAIDAWAFALELSSAK